jgi:hypothetical protein
VALRILGILLFVAGAVSTTYALRESFARPRPVAALFGLLSPVAVLIALLGALLIFVPTFF